MIPVLHVRLLGGFHLEYGEAAITGINTPRLQSLLAYLIIHSSVRQARRHLAFLFWPDSTEDQARTNLRHALHDLGRHLPDPARFLQIDRQTVQWQAGASVVVDAAAFEVAAHEAASTAELEQAVRLYGGALLPECYDDWILPERDRLHHDYLSVLERLAEQLEEERAYFEALTAAQRLLEAEPVHEKSYRRVMRLQVLNGDRAAALQTYRRCVTVLEKELAVSPNRITRQMYEQLRAADESLPAATQAPRPRLVGRQREWGELLRAWREGSAGKARLVLISGEAGIGKTRLAEEAFGWASQQGIRTGFARCYAGEGELAYAPVVTWLRSWPTPRLGSAWLAELARLLPELREARPDLPLLGPMAQSWQREQFFEALAHGLLDYGSPLLLVLDDLQWCDCDTAEWLHYLLRFAPDAPLLLLVTLRSGELQNGSPQAQLLSALRGRKQLLDIELGPLGSEETAQLATQALGKPLDRSQFGLLFEKSDGNPLFALELLRSREDHDGARTATDQHAAAVDGAGLPATIQQVIQERLAQLSPDAHDLVRLAAVIGRSFTFDGLLRAGGREARGAVEALDELWQRRIIREQNDGEYNFSHELIREVVYAGLTAARRRWLHRLAGEALEAIHASDGEGAFSGQIAAHFERAGLPELAIPHRRRAAMRARSLFANQEAIVHYQRLLALLPPPSKSEALLGLGQVLLLTGEWSEAESLLRQALAMAERNGESAGALAQCRQALGGVLLRQGRYDEALESLGQARSGFEALGDGPGTARTLRVLAEVHWYQGNFGPAREAVEEQMRIAADLGDRWGFCEAAEMAGMLCWSQSDYALASAHCAQALEAAAALGHRFVEGRASMTMGNICSDRGDNVEALDWFLRTFRVASAIGDRQGACFGNTGLAIIFASNGEHWRALSLHGHSLQMATQTGDLWSAAIALGNIGEIYRRLRRLTEARALYERAITLLRHLGSAPYLRAMLFEAARLLADQGEFDSALALNEEALRLSAHLGREVRVSSDNVACLAQVLDVRLRLALGQLGPLDAIRRLVDMIPDYPADEGQATIQYALWRLSPAEDRYRQAAAEHFRRHYEQTWNIDTRERFFELTGAWLPAPPSLPALPDVVPQDAIDIAPLLLTIDEAIAQLRPDE